MATKKRAPAAPRARARKARPPRPEFVSVAIVVSDRRRSLEWYTRNLGLDLIDSDDHWVTVGHKGRGGVLHLCQTSEYDTSIPAEKGNTGILFHLSGDFESACRALAANGVKFSHPAQKAEWGWWAMIEDPDGNEFSVTPGG